MFYIGFDLEKWNFTPWKRHFQARLENAFGHHLEKSTVVPGQAENSNTKCAEMHWLVAEGDIGGINSSAVGKVDHYSSVAVH